VGRSVVSAMTHTPASGPFALVTTPPMSSGSTATAPALPARCALTHARDVASIPASAHHWTFLLMPDFMWTSKLLCAKARRPAVTSLNSAATVHLDGEAT